MLSRAASPPRGGLGVGLFGLIGNDDGFDLSFSSSMGRVWSEMARNEAKARRKPSDGQTLSQDTTALLLDRQVSRSSGNFVKQGKDLDLESKETVYGASTPVSETKNAFLLSSPVERGYDMWVQVFGAKAHAGDTDSTLWVGYAGGHQFINENLIIGGLLQLDWADESNDTAGSSADGFGWLVSTKVSGLVEHGDIEIRPAVGVSYYEESQESYVDSTNTVIGSQTFTQGEFRFGPTFSKTLDGKNGATLKPRIGVNGVWNFAVDSGSSSAAVFGNGDLRARLDVGMTVLTTKDWFVDIAGFYDGIGANDYYAYGGKVRVTVPLQ